MYAINEVVSALFFLIDPATGKPATSKTVTAIVYDETFTQFSTPTVTEIAGGLYYAQFTPDTAGVWAIKFSCASPEQYGGLAFPVGVGNEALLANGTYGLSALNTDLDALLARLTATRAGYLDNLSGGAIALNADMATVLSRLSAARAGYLDNLSAGAVALEATLTAIKGVGWSTETLKAIKDAITALNNLTAAQVWAYATRSLTDKAGFTISGTKTTLDALNDITAASVWAVATRNLTAQAYPFTNAAAPVDLSNLRHASYTLLTDVTYGLSALNTDLDALLARLTATRAGYLDNLNNADLLNLRCTTLNVHALLKAKDSALGLSTQEAADVEGKVENAVDAGNLTHDITTVNDLAETQIVEIAKAGIYSLSVFFDLDTLETAAEGGTVKIRVYNKVDGTNYSDKPSAYAEYVVGQENEYPSVEINLVHGYCKVTIQCSTDVTATRTIAYRHLERDLGA